MIVLHKKTFPHPSGMDEEHTWALDLSMGIVFMKIIDEPNEADILVVKFWGLGYVRHLGLFVVPWKIKMEAV